MAEIKKIKHISAYNILKHNNRQAGDKTQHSNKEIDDSRTHLNYDLLKTGNSDLFRVCSERSSVTRAKLGNVENYSQIYKRYKDRLNEIFHFNRDNIVGLLDVIVTLPADVICEDEKFFFKNVYDFFANDFGEKNIISAVVHKDETTPHIHIDIIPALPLEKQEITPYLDEKIKEYEIKHNLTVKETLNAKVLITREYLFSLHPRLSDFIEEKLGYKTEILNGATAGGNRTILELKNEKLKQEIAIRQTEVDRLQKNINTIMKQLEESGLDKNYFSSTDILNKMNRLVKENEVLKKVVDEKNIIIPSDDIKEIISLPDSLSSRINYHLGFRSSISDFQSKQIEVSDFQSKQIVIVYETYKDRPRFLPEQNKIEEVDELVDIINSCKSIPFKIFPISKKSEAETQISYMLFPTDNIYDTLYNLMNLQDMLTDVGNAKDINLIMPQISNDKYNIAETFLNNLVSSKIKVDYYLSDKVDKVNVLDFDKVQMKGEIFV